MKCVSITNQFTSVKRSEADLIVDSNVDSHLNLETEKRDKGPRYGGSAMFDQFTTALGTLERTVDVRRTRDGTLKFNKTSKAVEEFFKDVFCDPHENSAHFFRLARRTYEKDLLSIRCDIKSLMKRCIDLEEQNALWESRYSDAKRDYRVLKHAANNAVGVEYEYPPHLPSRNKFFRRRLKNLFTLKSGRPKRNTSRNIFSGCPLYFACLNECIMINVTTYCLFISVLLNVYVVLAEILNEEMF